MSHYVSEDDTMMYNRWVQGIATRDLKGNPIMMSDLKQSSDTQNYTTSDISSPNYKLPKQLPYPLSTIYDDLADFTVTYSNILEKLRMGAKNPVTKEKDKEEFKKLIKHFEDIASIFKDMVKGPDDEDKDSKKEEKVEK